MTQIDHRPATGTDRAAQLRAAYDRSAAQYAQIADRNGIKPALGIGTAAMTGPAFAAASGMHGWPFAIAPAACLIFALTQTIRIHRAETDACQRWTQLAHAENTADRQGRDA